MYDLTHLRFVSVARTAHLAYIERPVEENKRELLHKLMLARHHFAETHFEGTLASFVQAVMDDNRCAESTTLMRLSELEERAMSWLTEEMTKCTAVRHYMVQTPLCTVFVTARSAAGARLAAYELRHHLVAKVRDPVLWQAFCNGIERFVVSRFVDGCYIEEDFAPRYRLRPGAHGRG